MEDENHGENLKELTSPPIAEGRTAEIYLWGEITFSSCTATGVRLTG